MARIIHPLMSLQASATRQELARQVAYLKKENRLLRVGKKMGTQLNELMSLASYRTFARWVSDKEDEPKKAKPVAKKNPDWPQASEDVQTCTCWCLSTSECGGAGFRWVSQWARNFQLDAEDLELPATFVMRDSDAKFSKQFDAVFAEPPGALGTFHSDVERRMPRQIRDHGTTVLELCVP